MRLLIVDDEAPARARIKTLLGDIAHRFAYQLVGEAANASDAMSMVADQRPDIILLDVQMPGLNGIEFARHFAAQPSAPSIVFISAHDDFALQAFGVHALDYLRKPVRAERLAASLARVAAIRASAPPPARNFSVQEKGRVLLVPAHQVLYLKADQKYVSLHTAQTEYLIENSLQSIEEEMPDIFVRVHRSALVARSAIIGVEKGTMNEADSDGEKETWLLILRGCDERLPVSRRQWPQVRSLLKA